MESILTILTVAILVEAIWENLKMTWQDGKFSLEKLGILILAIIVAILTKIDLFNVVGINITIPYVGSFLTGIIISRGANVVHDLFSKIQVLKEGK